MLCWSETWLTLRYSILSSAPLFSSFVSIVVQELWYESPFCSPIFYQLLQCFHDLQLLRINSFFSFVCLVGVELVGGWYWGGLDGNATCYVVMLLMLHMTALFVLGASVIFTNSFHLSTSIASYFYVLTASIIWDLLCHAFTLFTRVRLKKLCAFVCCC